MKKVVVCLLSIMISSVCWAGPQHAVSMHGKPKYPADFEFFDYVNPNAPKGGVLRNASFGSFDTFNPFSIKGNAAPGIGFLFEPLMKMSDDEPFSLYGLIAESIDIAPDRKSVTFTLRPQAHFSDGTPIGADDVVFSFNTLKQKGVPQYRYYYNDVEAAVAEADKKVRFLLKESDNRELPLILGQMPVLSKKYWEGKDFGATTLDIPVGSGPYKIKSFSLNRNVIYEKDPNYWGRDLPANRGFDNFDEVQYDIYRDTTVAAEAFKAGAYDIRIENEAKKWVSAYDGLPHVIKKEVHHGLPSGMQGFVFNTRRPLFQDPKVREALLYAFDFNWTNEHLFYGLYTRTKSFFDNSDLAAKGLPTESEKRLLSPFKGMLDERVFTTPIALPVFDTQNPRPQLLKALSLLKQAGWSIENGVLKNEKGEPFEFEILLDSSGSSAWERITLPFVQNLKKIGIKARIRTMDALQYKNRLDNFDYDMFVMVWGQSLSPGNEQRYFWGSESADQKGSYNFAGVRSKAVDALIEKVVRAQTREELQTATHALDRVLMYGFYVIPHWYSPVTRMVYWDKIDFPKAEPMQGLSIMTGWGR